MKYRIVMASAFLALTALTAAPAFAKVIDTVASFTVLANVVKNVGGKHVRVHSLVGPNGDPHEFEPSPNDGKLLNKAAVVFVSGDGLEGWMNRLIKASGYKGHPVVASDGIKTRRMVDDGKTIIDPHVWNNPLNVKIWVHNIEKALIAADPADKKSFEKNAKKYLKVLDGLNAYAHKKFDGLSKEHRKILTSHDAFGYFGDEYHVTFLSPVGFSTETEASAATVAKLIDQIKKEKVKTYFFENSNDPRLVKQIAHATGAKAGGELYVEALSKKSGPAPTYRKMFLYNVNQLAAAMEPAH